MGRGFSEHEGTKEKSPSVFLEPWLSQKAAEGWAVKSPHKRTDVSE